MASNDLNLCQFIGRLGGDPETRYLPSGDAVVSFSLACGWKGKDSEGTEWVRCSAFGKLAEIIAEYCKKGQQIYVAGRMRTRKWQTKEGEDRYSTEIVADRMQLLGSKRDGEQSERPARQDAEPASRPAPAKSGGGAFDEMDDDIPF
ncbi:MAG: single-stranded DNA-binding protein [Rhodospirillaceae bacterium]